MDKVIVGKEYSNAIRKKAGYWQQFTLVHAVIEGVMLAKYLYTRTINKLIMVLILQGFL